VTDGVGLVIFDCDGVLVDSERLTVAVEATVLTDLGWPHTAEQVVARWMGRTSVAQLAEIEERLGAGARQEYDERSTALVHAAFERELREIAGVTALLDELDAAGLPTCVASSGTYGRMRRTLGLTGLWQRFEGRIFSATEVAHGKPAPDLFLHAADGMGVRAERCVVVEDSVYGVRAAVAAGMRVLGYGGGLTAPEVLEAAGAEVLHDMAAMSEVLLDTAVS
jgi:HAD superfamily hydrolase (TIGR01509 family)